MQRIRVSQVQFRIFELHLCLIDVASPRDTFWRVRVLSARRLWKSIFEPFGFLQAAFWDINQSWPGPLDLYFCLDSKEIFFFYCKVNQKSINPGLGLWIAIFFWIRVEKSIRNQSIQAWASGSFCLFGFEGKVNQKPINPGLGLWISRGQRRKVAGPATLPRSLLYLFRRCILSAENLRPLASNFKLETSTS